MAIATPGSTAATSRRARAIAPAKPVATAATRSPSPGEVRPLIWLLPNRSNVAGMTRAKSTPIATTNVAPPRTNRPARAAPPGSCLAMPSAMPMIGVDRGAMIMAPITVAVESASTPAEAMTADNVSIVQNADRFDAESPSVRSRSSVSSDRERR